MASAVPSAQALRGVRVLITRAQTQAGQLASLLRAQGAAVQEIPSIEIRPPASYAPFDAALKTIRSYDWMVLTSVNGVLALFARMHKLGLGSNDLHGLKIAAIGPATRMAIEHRGLSVDVMPDKYIAEGVVAALREPTRDKRVLLVRAKVARDVLPEELRKSGARVDVVEAYETVVPEASRKRLRDVLMSRDGRPDVITFTSSSTVKNFVELLGAADPALVLNGIKLASIGPVTSCTMRELKIPVHVEAREFTMEGLVAAIAEKFAGRTKQD
jgi:uroporphyrinogen-III synthase